MSLATVPLKQHYKLPDGQRKELSRRLLGIFSNVPKDVEETGNSKPLPDPEKSKPVADWWSK
jgi:hypothetical protein